MKTRWLALCLLIPFAACHKNSGTGPASASPTLVLLKVDYLTHRFEGGKSFHFTAGGNAGNDSIPLQVTYHPPNDFGNVTLQYGPTNDTLFDGGIIWSGIGTLHYPVFDPIAAFSAGNSVVPAPVAVQGIFTNEPHQPYAPATIAQAWAGIAKLKITQQMMGRNARAGLFLYTPSVGVGNPADWDYIWILYRNPG